MISTGLTLPTVSRLILVILVKGDKLHDQFLSMFNCPNITDLSIVLMVRLNGMASRSVYTHWQDLIQHYVVHVLEGAGSAVRYQNLTDLHLKVRTSDTRAVDASTFGYAVSQIPLASLPSLQRLMVEGLLSGDRAPSSGYQK